MRNTHKATAATRTHNPWPQPNLVMLPMLDGILPLSWLLLRKLSAQAERISAVRLLPSARHTHRYSNLVRLPMLDGILPLSWLLLSWLRAHAERLSAVRLPPQSWYTHR
jgi:hypothetical protein